MNRPQLIKDIKNHINIDCSKLSNSEIWELFKSISKDYKKEVKQCQNL